MNTTIEIDLSQHRETGRKLVQELMKELVNDSSSVQVSTAIGERTTIYQVNFNKECIGQILGSKGRNISAVRTLIASISARKGFRAIVEIPYFED